MNMALNRPLFVGASGEDIDIVSDGSVCPVSIHLRRPDGRGIYAGLVRVGLSARGRKFAIAAQGPGPIVVWIPTGGAECRVRVFGYEAPGPLALRADLRAELHVVDVTLEPKGIE